MSMPHHFAGGRSDFIEEKERSVARLKKRGIPTGIALGLVLDPIRHLHGCTPLAGFEVGEPDANVRVAFALAAEPGSNDVAGGLDQGRSMARGEGRGLVDELGLEEAGLGEERVGWFLGGEATLAHE